MDTLKDESEEVIATFRNARVTEKLRTRRSATGKTPTKWRQIIATQQHVQGHIDGNPKFAMLRGERDLQQFGSTLFKPFFPGQVRRLYDAARSEQTSQRLNLIFTPNIDWMADRAWEFVYDPDRRAHRRGVGPADCPFFYNEDRDVRSIACRLRLCAACRRQFKVKEGEEHLQAAEQILSAYP